MTGFSLDPRAQAVADRLQAHSRKQSLGLLAHFLPRLMLGRLTGKPYERMDDGFFRDKLVALDRDKCELLYMLCRGLGARRVVEVGTSFGLSTLYLAAAVRDVAPEGVVVTSEFEPSKVAAARAHFAEAGLSEHIDLREGDARGTLVDIDGPIDLILLDTWMSLARPMLDLLGPKLRPGGMILCDNIKAAAPEYRRYTDAIAAPGSGYRSITLPYAGGLELTLRDPA